MWWYVLGLDPNDNEKTVKKTYAKMIKGVNQDTEIDKFTKIHHAYRLAMKSFKAGKEEKKIQNMYQGDEGWYIEVLKSVYNDPKKRLIPEAWSNVMNCMSFTEEEIFSTEYVGFFNEHYYLTDEVWEVVEKNYPITKNKAFKWPDLCNGNFTISTEEVDVESKEKIVDYVEGKIRVFYRMLCNDYEEAYILLKPLVRNFRSQDLDRWYLMIVALLKYKDDILEAYNRLLLYDEEQYLAHYYYAGYYYKQADCSSALEELKRIPDSRQSIYVKALNAQVERLDTIKDGCHSRLTKISRKREKLLSKGHYEKALMVE